MTLHRTVLAIAVAMAWSTSSVQGADIVLTPSAGGGVSVTSADGSVTRLRVAEDGSVTIPGTIFKGSNRFIHNFGTGNTFIGEQAGNFIMTGANNTATGLTALASNTYGAANTAIGSAALGNNTEGSNNTATGALALGFSTTGNNNTATGAGALVYNMGGDNTAVGSSALFANLGGTSNVAVGSRALKENTLGGGNTAVGTQASGNNKGGDSNTAVGAGALGFNATGSGNIALGMGAGANITGSSNIAIGNIGNTVESGTIRIGDSSDHSRAFIAGIRGKTTGSANAIPVMIDANGQLGTVSSSARFKDDIADMDSATDALMQLRPVTFHYKEDQDPAGRTLQYGLIAEEVAQVYPGLVAHSADGQVETVMVQFLPPMLLNEFQKQQRTIASQSERLASQAARLEALEGELAEFRRMLGRPR
ncbi:hypothetical protein BWI17_12995 [Betaproteobacteria bacterium GR16-43]|nr:hypothetical protein BWI17_12995 [Betaproteobacteria bacterium GR16-43]